MYAVVLPASVLESKAEGAVASKACEGMKTPGTGEFGSSGYKKRQGRKRHK